LCAKQAWRFLWGESPHRVRPNQPLVPSVACVAEVITEIRVTEQNMRSVHRETCRPQERPHSLKPNAASSKYNKAVGDSLIMLEAYTKESSVPLQGLPWHWTGEIPEGPSWSS